MTGLRKCFIGLYITAVIGIAALAGCGSNNAAGKEVSAEDKNIIYGDTTEEDEGGTNEEKKLIYTSFFPVYDLTKRIAGDKMEIRTIIKGTQEPHDFEMESREMIGILQADLIIYNGAGMEGFIPDLMEMTDDKDKFLDLSQGLTLLEHKDSEEGDHSRINPHTWLSIKNAEIELDTIYRKISSIDPENEPFYKENLKASLKEFEELDKIFSETLSKVPEEKRYFVVSHAAFNYLAEDYGLKQVAITGISPEDEPSASQLKTIADFVKRHGISTIFFEGKATPKVANTLAENTGTKTSTLYTMENLSDEEISLGYLKLMRLNLEALMESFNE